jgi:hypothetical protein
MTMRPSLLLRRRHARKKSQLRSQSTNRLVPEKVKAPKMDLLHNRILVKPASRTMKIAKRARTWMKYPYNDFLARESNEWSGDVLLALRRLANKGRRNSQLDVEPLNPASLLASGAFCP